MDKGQTQEYTPILTHGQFEAELNYQAAMAVARSMRKRGLINDEQYSLIDTTFAQEFKPFFSTLLRG